MAHAVVCRSRQSPLLRRPSLKQALKTSSNFRCIAARFRKAQWITRFVVSKYSRKIVASSPGFISSDHWRLPSNSGVKCA
jgi:hypothetical protein